MQKFVIRSLKRGNGGARVPGGVWGRLCMHLALRCLCLSRSGVE